jgi:hypothetical protein
MKLCSENSSTYYTKSADSAINLGKICTSSGEYRRISPEIIAEWGNKF